MARATWTQRPPHGYPWVLEYLYCHQMSTQTHPRCGRRVSEKVAFRRFQVPLDSLNNGNFEAFRVPMAQAIWADIQWPLCWYPWVLEYPYFHQMTTQTQSRAAEGLRKKSIFRKIFQLTHASLKTAESSLARAIWRGGGRGYPDFGPRTPAMGSGVHIQILQDPDPNPHTAATIRKEHPSTPTPRLLPSQKRGTLVWG